MTEQEQKAFTAMREALEQVEQQWAESGWGFRESIRTTVQQALTAANAVTSECSKVTSEYSEQPEPPSDENIADAWISASDSDGIAYDGPSFERGYRLGRGEYDEYTGALVAAAKAEALTAANAVSEQAKGEAFKLYDKAQIKKAVSVLVNVATFGSNSKCQDGSPTPNRLLQIESAKHLHSLVSSEEFDAEHAFVLGHFAAVEESTEPAGWTGKTDIDAALIMLDRLDVRGEGDDARVDEISRTLRKLAAAPEAPVGQLKLDELQRQEPVATGCRWCKHPAFIVGSSQKCPQCGKVFVKEAPKVLEPLTDEQHKVSDSELLDFIEEHPHLTLRKHKNRWSYVGLTNYEYPTFATVREAVQAYLDAGNY